MSQWTRWCCILLTLIVSAAAYGGAAQRPTIVSRVDFEGYRRGPIETLRKLIILQPGDRYNKDALRRDVQVLRHKPYFASVHLEVRDDPVNTNAKIVIFHLM